MRLDVPLALLRPTYLDGDDGSRSESFEEVALVWAGRDVFAARQGNEAERLSVEATATFIIRWREDVSAGWKVEGAGINARVLAVSEGVGRARYVHLLCREET